MKAGKRNISNLQRKRNLEKTRVDSMMSTELENPGLASDADQYIF